MPRHFGRTVMVFRAIPAPVFRLEKVGSSSCGLGSPPEFVVSTSARTSLPCSRTARDSGRLPWGLISSSRRQHGKSTLDERPGLIYVPSAAFLALSTACSSPHLAGLFHPAATSRIRAPGGSSPDPASPPRRWPVPPRRWRRSPVASCLTTPARVASTSRSSPESGSATSVRGLAPANVRVPSCVSCSFGLRSVSLGSVVTASSARALTVGAACAPAAGLQRIVD